MGEVARQCAAMMEAMRGTPGASGGEWGAGGMMGMGGMGAMLAIGPVWLVTIAALLALLMVGVIWLQRRREPAEIAMPAQSARQTLDLRYATGELDRETYLQMRSDLEVAG